jgi:enoyl-CoA hydratase/carnithine racemase
MISVERQDTIAVIKLDRGVTNALNLEHVVSLRAELVQAQEDDEVQGLVLASTNHKFFSIGFDIPELFELPRSEFEHFYSSINRVFWDLLVLPKPTVAALTGHAIAGGCVLALCSDYRLIAEGRKLIGLNEVKLGVPVPYIADCVLRQLVGFRAAREIEDLGEFFPPDQARTIGLVDRVLPLDQVLPEAIERCKTLGAMPPKAFAMIKRNRTEGILERVASRLEERERYFVDCWYSEQTRKRLREAMEKF